MSGNLDTATQGEHARLDAAKGSAIQNPEPQIENKQNKKVRRRNGPIETIWNESFRVLAMSDRSACFRLSLRCDSDDFHCNHAHLPGET